ncbi:MAG: hypothetical protein ACOCUH_00115 [Bacteriovoracia bacterium]
MKFIVLSFLLLSTSFCIRAQDTEKLYYTEKLLEEEVDGKSLQEVEKNPLLYLDNQSIVSDHDESTGIKSNYTYTGNDQSRTGIQLHFNYNPFNISDILGFEVSFDKRLEQLWLSFEGQYLKGSFGSIASNPQGIQTTHPVDSEAVVMQGGVGLGYRFKLLAFWDPADNVFETLNAYATYNRFSDDFDSTDYSGFGLKADYGIHIRSSSDYFYGGKLAYNWAIVEREAQDATESSIDRTLHLSWISLAFEFGFYY